MFKIMKSDNMSIEHALCFPQFSGLFLQRLTLPDLSLLLPTTLSDRGGGFSGRLLTHEPFALTTSNLVGC